MEPITAALLSFAPDLVKWITGNDKAEQVTKVALDVAKGITCQATANGAVDVLGANPELVIQFRQALAGIEADLEKAYLGDTANARQREIAIATSDSAPMLNKIITPVLALIVVVGGGFILAYNAQPDVRTAASNLMMLVLGYYFGTSVASKRKDDTINQLTKGN
jgi:hypothetical protein